MVRNPFKSEPPTPPTEDLITPLQNEIDKLERDSFRLHGLIMATAHKPTKDKLMAKRAKIIEKITTLKAQQQNPKEEQASYATDKLFKDPNRTFILELNGHRVKPTKDLMITLKFYPCGHKKTIHIKDLIHPKPRTEQALLTHWKTIFNANTTLTGGFNCQECRKAKQKLREQHRYSDADRIGTVRFMLRLI